jgi:hypothetical protein
VPQPAAALAPVLAGIPVLRLERFNKSGNAFGVVAEIPADETDITAFNQDQIWDGDTWWCPVEWKGSRLCGSKPFAKASVEGIGNFRAIEARPRTADGPKQQARLNPRQGQAALCF